MHTPLIAAIVGLPDPSTASMSSSRLGTAIAAGVLNSLISAPPENTLSVPVITTTRTAASTSARCSDSSTPLRTACARPLIGGLSIWITAVASRRSQWTLISNLQPLLMHQFIRAQLLRRAFEHDMAVAHHVDPLRDGERNRE